MNLTDYLASEDDDPRFRKTDRTLVFEPLPGFKKANTILSYDNIRVVMDLQTNLWSFKTKTGSLPEPLKGKFTNFEQAKKYISRYLGSRKLKIKEVID